MATNLQSIYWDNHLLYTHAGANCKGPWITVWFLYTRNCDVNVHITKEQYIAN